METSAVALAKTESRHARRLLTLVLCLGLSAFAAVPFFFMGRAPAIQSRDEVQMPVTHDMHLHFEQMKSFYAGLAAGAIYPRWEEDTNRRFGAPTTNYYPPGIYYLTSALYALLSNWWATLLVTYLIMMAGSAAAIYVYARESMSRVAASVAMAAYIFLPYHILDQYQRGAMAELLGFIWTPLMMLFGERLLRRSEVAEGETLRSSLSSSRSLNIGALALVYGAFLWTHPPTAYQFTLMFVPCMLLLAFLRREIKGLLSVGVAMAIGGALSAAYLGSAAIEADLIRNEYVAESWPYHTTYVFVHDLPYRAPHMGFFNLIDATWVCYAVSIVVMGVVLGVTSRRRGLIPDALRERTLIWLVMGCLAAFMMTKASYYAGGTYIPKIDIGVFTWRMLSISTLAVALLAAACVEASIHARRRRARKTRGSLLAAASLALVAGIGVTAALVVRPMYLAPAFKQSLEHINLAMIPRTAFAEPVLLPKLNEAHFAADGSVEIERWDPQHRVLRVETPASDRLLVRTFNFPGWTGSLDGEPVSLETGPVLGEIIVEVPRGTHRIELSFQNTPSREIGGFISLAALAVILLLLSFPLALVRLRRAY